MLLLITDIVHVKRKHFQTVAKHIQQKKARFHCWCILAALNPSTGEQFQERGQGALAFQQTAGATTLVTTCSETQRAA
jgi:hypothetical protein